MQVAALQDTITSLATGKETTEGERKAREALILRFTSWITSNLFLNVVSHSTSAQPYCNSLFYATNY